MEIGLAIAQIKNHLPVTLPWKGNYKYHPVASTIVELSVVRDNITYLVNLMEDHNAVTVTVGKSCGQPIDEVKLGRIFLS